MSFADVATLIGLVVLLIGGVNIGRSRRKDELIDLQEKQAAALRQEMADNERRCDDKIARLVADNAELRGRVALLTEHQAETIGRVVAPIVVAAIRKGEA